MGGRASKELIEAQGTVKRLTGELQHVMRELDSKKAHASTAATLQQQVAQLTTNLQSAKRDLELSTGQLRLAEQEKIAARKLRIQLDSAQMEIHKREEDLKRAQELREQEKASLELLQQAGKLLQSNEDPTLGKLVADMGHKIIYRANPITLLAQTQVWRKQRAFRPARAEKIAQSKLKSAVSGWPGTITAAYIAEADSSKEQEGALVIVDGQHRLGACSFLESKGQLHDNLKEVTVEVYPSMKEEMIRELFIEINKCEPVLDVDIPEVHPTDNHLEILTGAADMLKAAYPTMFKESQNCKRPFINIDKLRNEIHQADIIKRKKFKTPEELYNWLQETNTKLGQKTDEELKGITSLQREKARAGNFYLGISWDWLTSDV